MRPRASIFCFLAAAVLAACPPPSKGSGSSAAGGKAVIDTESQPKEKDPRLAAAVATIGDRKITVGQLERAINKQNPYVRMRYASVAQRKRFLKNMVRLEVLAAEARKRGLYKDPEVIRRAKRVLVDRLLQQLHKNLVKLEDITDADVQAFYDKHKERYHQAAKVRVSMVVAKTKAIASKVLALAKKKRTDTRYFAQLVNEYSVDPATKVRRGDLDFFEADSKKYAPEVVKQAFAIKGLWGLSEPFKTKGGWAVLLKTGERAEINRPLELEKNRIRNRLFNMRRFTKVNDYVKSLRAKAAVKIDEKNLASVKIETSKTTKLPRGGGHHKH
ncbi:MAG: peptidyl-prolyl cis-trans isomerase [Myxococcales bacterium]|nr:peptidyl-prolyl cis-trans isomerase [Myxococcales bacterium]